jgi:hypothetical protein
MVEARVTALQEHESCLFAAAPIIDCGRDLRVPALILAEFSWPLTVVIAIAFALAIYALGRSIYARDIDWDQEPEPKPLRLLEDISRDAGA